MKWQLTSHALERYLQRIAPDLGSDYARAEAEVRDALGRAKRDREAERVAGRRGQVLAAEPPRLDARGQPAGRRPLTHFVVLPPVDPTTRGRSVLVTCWPSDFAGDDAADLADAVASAADGPPPGWSPPPEPAMPPEARGWGDLVGRIEVARMRAAQYRAEQARAGALRRLVLELAARDPEAARLVRERAPELAPLLPRLAGP